MSQSGQQPTDAELRQRLAEAERARWLHVLEASLNEIYIFDAETLRFQYVNHGARRNLGYRQEQLQSMTPLDLKPEFNEASFHAMVGPLLRHEKAVHVFQTVHRRADGSCYPVEVHLQLVEQEGRRFFLAVILDITERKQAEALLACQTNMLELIATGAPLASTLTTLIEKMEALEPGLLGSVLLLDGVHLRHGAAPSLPEAYTRAIDGVAIGPSVGSCGTAAFRGEAVIVEDIATDPLWKDCRELAVAHGLRACWSTPIFDEQRRVLGTFAIYHRQPGRPSAAHLRCIELATDLAAIAIEKQRKEEALRQSELRFRRIFEESLLAYHSLDPEGRLRDVNPTWLALLGYSREEVIGRRLDEFLTPASQAAFAVGFPRFRESGAMRSSEFEMRRKDGVVLTFAIDGVFVRDTQGRPAYTHCVLHNITERKQAEAALRESEARNAELARFNQEVLDALTAHICVLAEDGTILAVNQAWRAFAATNPPPPARADVGANYLAACEAARGEDAATAREAVRGLRAVARGEVPEFRLEYPCHSPDTQRWFLMRATRFAGPGPACLVVSHVNITDRKRAAEALRQSEAQFKNLFESSPDAIVVATRAGVIRTINRQAERLFGYAREELVGQAIEVLMPARFRSGHVAMREDYHRDPHIRPMGEGRDLWARRKDGTEFPADISLSPMTTAEGMMVISTIRDITARQRAEAALRESEARFRQLAETIEDVFWMTDAAKERMLYVSPAYEKIWGRTCQSLYESPSAWLEAIHPNDRARILEAAMMKQTIGAYDEEYRIVRPDGQVRWVRDRAFPVRNADGQIERLVGVARDITERRQIEEQLRQSQKMEAIGHLAGGVAHDFNNILAAMMMQAELSGMADGVPPEVQEGLQQIRAGAERAANLTRQLLLFSRKQVMQPRDLDLNEVVTSLAKLLQRIIGEDVRLQLNLHPRPLMTRADAGMLDQVLMNLVVNARDAMPEGGRLFIETTEIMVTEAEAAACPDASPGRHVCLRVTDTGSGIAPEILARIFEPFFTTKAPGKGTGLGLATVFGIVKQHGGWLAVESAIGKGTTFQVFLAASKAAPSPEAAAEHPGPRGGAETILLVEDDSAVRLLTRSLLERHGYQVLEAAHGVEALEIWEQQRDKIQLLFTDLVMPEGISGHELAARLRTRNPQLRVIFASGYSGDIAGRELCLQAGQNFIQKPASPYQLLETVRRCLDSPASERLA